MEAKLKRFDGIDIKEFSETEQFKRVENLPFTNEDDIRKIEKLSREIGKPILNFTLLDKRQKEIMGNAVKKKIHVKVDFIFIGYWITDKEIVMLTRAKKMIMPK